VYEYEYVSKYIHASAFSLLRLDLQIIAKGMRVMMRGKGL